MENNNCNISWITLIVRPFIRHLERFSEPNRLKIESLIIIVGGAVALFIIYFLGNILTEIALPLAETYLKNHAPSQ